MTKNKVEAFGHFSALFIPTFGAWANEISPPTRADLLQTYPRLIDRVFADKMRGELKAQ